MVPVAIALVGVLLGGAALYFALSNRGAASAIDDVKSDLATTQAELKAVEKNAADLDSKFSDLAQTNSSLGTQIQNVTGQVNDALNQMGKAITDDRAQLKTQADALAQLTAKPSSASTSSASSGSDKTTTPAPTTTAQPGVGGIHVIASGDTFGLLAKKYGVSVSAIEAANPDANPTRLHLGQKIIIPPASAPSAPAASSTPSETTAAPSPATPPAGA
jgi:LysM repeat protein